MILDGAVLAASAREVPSSSSGTSSTQSLSPARTSTWATGGVLKNITDESRGCRTVAGYSTTKSLVGSMLSYPGSSRSLDTFTRKQGCLVMASNPSLGRWPRGHADVPPQLGVKVRQFLFKEGPSTVIHRGALPLCPPKGVSQQVQLGVEPRGELGAGTPLSPGAAGVGNYLNWRTKRASYVLDNPGRRTSPRSTRSEGRCNETTRTASPSKSDRISASRDTGADSSSHGSGA